MKSITKALFRKLYTYLYSYRQGKGLTAGIQRNYILENGNGDKSTRYIALGDSLTYGYGASSYKGTFPYILSQTLLKKYRRVEVHNLAVCGAGIVDLLHKQVTQAIKSKPNYITILIGTNDVHNFFDIKKFKDCLENIINQLKNGTNAQILIINIPYLISCYMTFPPYNKIMDWRIKRFNRAIEKIAKLKAIKYFDLYYNAKEYFKKNSSFYSSDWFHPSDKGYILWGNLLKFNED